MKTIACKVDTVRGSRGASAQAATLRPRALRPTLRFDLRSRTHRLPISQRRTALYASPPLDSPPTTPTAAVKTPPSASTDLGVIAARLASLSLPYWQSPDAGGGARWKLAGVVGLTLATTGVSVVFNFLGRDFFNALSEKNPEAFTHQIFLYLGAFVVGIPVFVFKSYYQSKLSLEWRQWMTENTLKEYFADRSFYQLLSAPSGTDGSVDNPDQRISSDINVEKRGFGVNVATVNPVV